MEWLSRIRAKTGFNNLPAGLRKIIVGVIGVTLLIIGTVMIVLPGPALLVIPAGLAILATEFAWARHLVRRARGLISRRQAGNSDTAGTIANVSR
jgi:uncharacterized protein (TIGR02611 family)